MEKKIGIAAMILVLILLTSISLALAASTIRIINGAISNATSHLMKRLWTITATPKLVITKRPQVKFESGYSVETVFDGSKLGIEPFSVEVGPSGELYVLDSVNNNMYRISLPLSRYSRPKLIAGSVEGYDGHVDGRPRVARMNHPKGFTVDDRGNIYVVDTSNMAIRKNNDTGVSTIAGGKWNRGGHTDGPSEDAKFSNDFEVVYVASSFSLLVIDRGKHAIREIQLHFDDCAYQYGSGFPLGIAVLFAAAFFGYMLALLQQRVGGIVSSKDEPWSISKAYIPPPPYQKPVKLSVRPPLIPAEDSEDIQEEGIFTSTGKLITMATSSLSDIFSIVFKTKPKSNQQQYRYHNIHQLHHQQQLQRRSNNSWPMQESFEIPDEDEPPPPLETRTPTPQKTYAFMTNDPEKIHNLRQGRAYFNGWNGNEHVQQQHQQHMHQQHVQQHMHQLHVQQNIQHLLGSQTFYEQSCENTKEIVFGAVKELDSKKQTVEIKSVNYGESHYEQYGLRSRMSYDYGYNGF